MSDEQLLERISINPEVMLGKPVIKGTRVTVEYVIDRITHGASIDDLIQEYEGIIRDDILACQLFAQKFPSYNS